MEKIPRKAAKKIKIEASLLFLAKRNMYPKS